MSKGERKLGKEILKDIKEAGKKTGWDVSVEEKEDDNFTDKTKEELKRSERKDENNNNKNMGEKEKGEKIANKEDETLITSDMSKEEIEKILEERRKETEERKVKDEKKEVGEKEEKRERKPERIPRFYEGTAREDETRLLNEFTEKFKLDPDREKNIKDVLLKEKDERRIEFAVKWFDEHRRQLEKKEGISSDLELLRDKKAEIAMRNGAFEELWTKKKYKEDKIDIENIYVISADFDKRKDCSIEGQILVLNTLDKRIEKMKGELTRMEESGRPEIEINEKLKELGNLFEDIKELTAKIKGLEGMNLEDFAENKAGLLENKDSYIEKLLDERKQGEEFCKKSKLLLGEEMTFKRWEDMSDFYKEKFDKKFGEKMDEIKKKLKEAYPKKMMTVDDEKILALMNAGYDVEEIRLKRLDTLVELRKTDGKKDTVKYKEFSEFLKERMEDYNKEVNDKSEDELGREWDEKKRIRDEEVKKIINEEIKAIAGSPEKAEKGIQGLFDRVKGKLIDEDLKEGAKKQKKTAEELEKLKKEYEVKGMMEDTHRFMSEIMEGKGGLDKISGDIEEDPGIIENYFRKNQGIETSEEEIRNFIENQEKAGVLWGETRKSEKGLLDYFIELVKFIFASKKEEENK
ncbi:MAG: hypothetical protein WBC21_00705 [Minisyncoccales bacterium]